MRMQRFVVALYSLWFCAVATACSSASPAEADTAAKSATDTSGGSIVVEKKIDEPTGAFDAYVQSQTGFTTLQLSARRHEMFQTAIDKCLASKGWEQAEYAQLIFDPTVDVLKFNRRGQAATQVLQLLDQFSSAGPSTAAPSVEIVRAFEACSQQAKTSTPDPIKPVLDELDKHLDEHNSRVLADPRVVAADAKKQECIGAEGYDAAAYEQAQGDIIDQGNAIIDDVAADKISLDEARSSLTKLYDSEVEKWGAVADCYTAHDEVVSTVSQEVDLALVEENAAAFDDLFATMAAEVNS